MSCLWEEKKEGSEDGREGGIEGERKVGRSEDGREGGRAGENTQDVESLKNEEQGSKK